MQLELIEHTQAEVKLEIFCLYVIYRQDDNLKYLIYQKFKATSDPDTM